MIGLIAYFVLPVSVPLILAFISALFLEPFIRFFIVKTSMKRQYSIILIFCIFLFLIGIITFFIITEIVGQAINLIENAPTYIQEISAALVLIQNYFTSATEHLPETFSTELNGQIQAFINSFNTKLSEMVTLENVKDVAAVLFMNIPSFLISFLVYLIALFLFMVDLPNLKKRLYRHFKEETAEKVDFMIARHSNVVFGFIKAQFLVSVLIFLVSFLGLLWISPNIALIMALIIWVINFIPIIGSILIVGPWALFHLITGDILLGVELAILTAIIIFIKRTVEPKLMGSPVGLSPLSTLVSMYLGLKIIGLLGIIIGPLVVIAFNSAKEAGIIKMNFTL